MKSFSEIKNHYLRGLPLFDMMLKHDLHNPPPYDAWSCQRRKEELCGLMNSVESGRKLMDLARQRGIEIVLEDLDIHGNGLGYEINFGNYNGHRIVLNRRFSSAVLLSTLAHELTHLAQDVELDLGCSHQLNSKDRVLFTRLIEGDANARAFLVVRDINEKHNLAIPNQHIGFLPLGLKGVVNWLFGRNSSSDHILNSVFTSFQKSSVTSTYDSKSVAERSNNSSSIYARKFNAISRIIGAGYLVKGFYYLGAKNKTEFFGKLEQYVPMQYRR